MIREAANSRISYTELPMIQCSAIHHSLIEQLRAQTGRVFQSRCPDIYSSFAFAHLAGSDARLGVERIGVARLLAEGADTPCRTRQAAVAKHGGARLDAAREPAEQSDVVAGHAAPQGHRASASSVGLLALRIRFKT